MLLFSARSGALAQRIGPRIPLTLGPLIIALGMLMMTRIEPDSSYVGSVLPAVIVFGAGLTLVVAPVTATVLAAADSRHSGIASGINNAVSRVGGLLAVAVLPLIAGITGDAFYDPVAMTEGFHTAMFVTAGLSGPRRHDRLVHDRDPRPRPGGAGRRAGHRRVLVRHQRPTGAAVAGRGAVRGRGRGRIETHDLPGRVRPESWIRGECDVTAA